MRGEWNEFNPLASADGQSNSKSISLGLRCKCYLGARKSDDVSETVNAMLGLAYKI